MSRTPGYAGSYGALIQLDTSLDRHGGDGQSGKESLNVEDLISPPFNQEFRLKSAMRDTIRQAILENMLDDRHDLTGNSVYGLKFERR